MLPELAHRLVERVDRRLGRVVRGGLERRDRALHTLQGRRPRGRERTERALQRLHHPVHLGLCVADGRLHVAPRALLQRRQLSHSTARVSEERHLRPHGRPNRRAHRLDLAPDPLGEVAKQGHVGRLEPLLRVHPREQRRHVLQRPAQVLGQPHRVTGQPLFAPPARLDDKVPLGNVLLGRLELCPRHPQLGLQLLLLRFHRLDPRPLVLQPRLVLLVLRLRHVHPVLLPRRHQLGLEPRNLPAHLLEMRRLGDLLVHLRLVLDILRPVRVFQRRHRLLLALHGRRDGRDDARLGPAAQRVPEEPRELRVPVWDMPLPFHQRRDHPPQRQQALVDVPGLLGPLVDAVGPGAGDVLAPGQVHQVELAHADHLFAFRQHLAHRHGNDEHGMRARALLVQQRLCRPPPRVPRVQQRVDVPGRLHNRLLQPLHHHAGPRVLHDAHLLGGGRTLGLARQKVGDLLVVQLEERTLDRKLVHPTQTIQILEYMPHRPRNHARLPRLPTRHRVRLARARLPVRKHRAVEPLEHLVHHRRHGSLIQPLLRRVRIIHLVEVVLASVLLLVDRLRQLHLLVQLVALHDLRRVVRDFRLGPGPGRVGRARV